MSVLGFVRRAALSLAMAIAAPALIVSGAMLTATAAQAATLSSIQVSGNDRIDTATIRSYVTVDFGQSFGQSDLNDTLNVLFATGFFADVDVTSGGNTIFIAVVENPVVVQITFIGNRKVRDPQLAEIVQTQERGVLSEALLAADIRAIEERYRREGRGAATVDVEVQPVDGNLANVIFYITEGERVRIAAIEFEGNSAFSDRQLEAVIQTRESGLFTWLSKDDVYSAAGLDLDRELLRRHYLENGYADFQVIAVDVVYDEAAFSYTIRIVVSEGPRYRFGNVSVDSTIDGVTYDTLRRAIFTRTGRVFNALDLEQSLEEITVALADLGLPFARVTPQANRDYTQNTIDIRFLIDPGPRAFIERIDIIGNTRTRDYVIRRVITMAEGDAYNRVLVDRVERELMGLGIFQSVDIRAVQGSSPDLVRLTVYVVEAQTGQINATAGYSTTDGIIGEVSYEETNFLGRGQHLRMAFTIGFNNRNYSISFTEPFFLGRNLPFGFDLFQRTTGAGGLRPYGESQTGGQIRLGLPITRAIAVQASYRLVTQTITASPPALAAVYPNGTTVTSSAGLTLTYNTIDNMSDPRSGFFIRGGIEYAGLGGTNSFLRSTLDARWYRPIGYESPIVGLLRFRAGNITGIGQPVRAFDQFLQGGETIRGFANAGYGPRVADGTATGLGVGGNTYWNATAEISFPLPFISEDAGFRGAVFADAGMLFGTDLPGGLDFGGTFADTTLRASVGASVMWASPIGLLRVDYARVLSSAAYDVTQTIRFSVGTQF